MVLIDQQINKALSEGVTTKTTWMLVDGLYKEIHITLQADAMEYIIYSKAHLRTTKIKYFPNRVPPERITHPIHTQELQILPSGNPHTIIIPAIGLYQVRLRLNAAPGGGDRVMSYKIEGVPV